MEEIEQLRKRFMEVQEKDTNHTLSQRNCVEIISKILQLKIIDHLIVTQSAREYLTERQLEREILDELLRNGGRVKLEDIPDSINVDVSAVTAKATFISKKDRSIYLIEGDLISKYYLDTICEEINELLQSKGHLSLTDLSLKFELPIEFFVNVAISPRLGRIIQGLMDLELLYTQSFIDHHTAVLRGCLTAATSPVSLSPIIAQFGLKESILENLLPNLITKGVLAGSVSGKGSNTTFTPSIYTYARQMWIDSFYRQNQYVSFKTLREYDFRVDWMAENYNGVALITCYVDQFIIDSIDDSITQSLSENSWIDIRTIVPSFFSDRDSSLAISKCQSIKTLGASVYSDYFIVSKDFIAKCLAILEKEIKERAEKFMLESANTPETPSPQIQPKVTKEKETKKGKRGGKRGDDDDDVPVKASSSKEGKRPSFDVVKEGIEILGKHFPDLESSVLDSIVVQLRSTLRAIQESASKVVFTENLSDRKNKHLAFQEQLNVMYLNLLMFKNGIQDKAFDSERGAIEKHLLRTLSQDMITLLTEHQAIEYIPKFKSISNAAERASIIEKLPPTSSKSLEKLIQASTKTLDVFIEQLITTTEDFQIRLQRLDRKTEKHLLNNSNNELLHQLQSETNVATCLQVSVLLLFLKTKQLLVNVPARNIALLLSMIEGEIPAKDFSFLKEYQQLVVAYLSSKDSEGKEKFKEKLDNDLDKLKSSVLQIVEEGTKSK
eukprot:TRINITY_DN6855_c0_g1_i5.p1 TRINITY_DN6855_c0_g1~~TRINITY_DN6855_c0_g1_i5.p1  ORF type:complete len:724 (-),score=154.38 TRINITY_DN6855_c0_g1_i5:148-2319(-)